MIEDPIQFEVVKNSLISVAREMSISLRMSAFSPNIKERRDCSCAVFDQTGDLIAQSEDIPVHLGAMPLSVKACIDEIGDAFGPGTMACSNDPFAGGSHLPDLTLVAPIFHNDECVGYVANRAHHADIGGVSPGSMPGLSTSIHDEGVLIHPRLIVENGRFVKESVKDLMMQTRTPEERYGDLSSQIAANNVGVKRVLECMEKYGHDVLLDTMGDLKQYSGERMKNALEKFDGLSAGFTDFMDSDGAGTWEIPICVSVAFSNGNAIIDFDETSPQVRGNVNCPIASTLSAVYFVFIALFARDIPVNQGCWDHLEVKIPEGSLLNPRFPAAVSAGNVETTQRVVDTILGALAKIMPDRIPAASQGTMNNLSIGGIDERTSKRFSFYETIGGGVGAMRGLDGTSGIHSHMTNTLNTPIEVLEVEYPLRVLEYSIRRGSGGHGQWRGGDGLVREIQVLSDECTISIQSERRHRSPWGLNGGGEGMRGKNTLIVFDTHYQMQAKSTVDVFRDAIIKIETPGGGGWGETSTHTIEK